MTRTAHFCLRADHTTQSDQSIIVIKPVQVAAHTQAAADMTSRDPSSSTSQGEAYPQPSSSRYTHPVRLLVQARHDPGAAPPGASKPDILLVKQALARQAEHKRRAEKWADRMMEEPVGLDGLRKGVSLYSPRAGGLAALTRECRSSTCRIRPTSP